MSRETLVSALGCLVLLAIAVAFALLVLRDLARGPAVQAKKLNATLAQLSSEVRRYETKHGVPPMSLDGVLDMHAFQEEFGLVPIYLVDEESRSWAFVALDTETGECLHMQSGVMTLDDLVEANRGAIIRQHGPDLYEQILEYTGDPVGRSIRLPDP